MIITTMMYIDWVQHQQEKSNLLLQWIQSAMKQHSMMLVFSNKIRIDCITQCNITLGTDSFYVVDIVFHELRSQICKNRTTVIRVCHYNAISNNFKPLSTTTFPGSRSVRWAGKISKTMKMVIIQVQFRYLYAVIYVSLLVIQKDFLTLL